MGSEMCIRDRCTGTVVAPKALFDRCQITKSAPEKPAALDIHIYPYITLARLFEGLDEVWDNNVRPLKKILGKWPCFEEPRFHFL
mgnify:CR=1 FL=1